jgi:murein DD-endopeptidase MepM/ murein hydrolase activator NlpD
MRAPISVPVSVILREQAVLSSLASPPLARENTNSNRFHKSMPNRVTIVSISVRLAILSLLVCALCTVAALAQKCTITPKSVKLGETLRLTCPPEFTSATLNGRAAKLFPQSSGNNFALLPISVKDVPGIATLTVSRDDGARSQQLSVVIRKTIFPSQNVKLAPEIEALHSTPEEIALLTSFREKTSDSRSWQDPLAPPVPGCMTSPFGVKRLHNGKPTGEYHGGVDQRTPAGESIRAVAAGTVTFAQQFNVLGNAVGIDHGQGLESMYLHMSKLVALPGAQVQRGDILGYAGSTGRSTGPHLHWVLYVNGVNVNPAQWMKLSPCPREPNAH